MISQTEIKEAVLALRDGGLVVFATDTVYGVAADDRVPGAMESLYAAKGRRPEKPIARLAATPEQIQADGAEMSQAALRIAKAFWPGALTLVLPRHGDWMGYRIPDHPLALALLEAVDHPLPVTSANRSGEVDACSVDEARSALGSAVQVYLDAGRSPGGTPSTVLRIQGNQVDVLREGPISEADWRPLLDD